MVSSQCEGDWQDSPWTDIEIGGVAAKKRHLMAADEAADFAWRVYIFHIGECYHAILLNASPIAMEFNGDFYEDVVQSFNGISRIP